MEEINENLFGPENSEKYSHISQSPESEGVSDDAPKTAKEQNLHDKLIIMQAINYKKQGYTDIKINRSNYHSGRPDTVGGYTPDLSAVFNNEITICDIETGDPINETEVVKKWTAFDRSGYNFHLIVSNSAFNEVKEIARSHGITVDKYWCSKDC